MSDYGPPLDLRQRYSDDHETTQTAHDGRQAQIHTAQPGIIGSFDATKMTVQVQPAIQGVQTMLDGTRQPMTVQPLHDVPVHFPAGGGYTMTFPITAKDEAVLIHQQRSIDHWHQMGGTQQPSDWRMHDVNDAIAMVGLRSAPNVIPDVHTKNAHFRSDDGKRYVEIDNSNDMIRIIVGDTTVTVDNKNGVVEIVAKTIKLTASEKIELAAPEVDVKSAKFSSEA